MSDFNIDVSSVEVIADLMSFKTLFLLNLMLLTSNLILISSFLPDTTSSASELYGTNISLKSTTSTSFSTFVPAACNTFWIFSIDFPCGDCFFATNVLSETFPTYMSTQFVLIDYQFIFKSTSYPLKSAPIMFSG